MEEKPLIIDNETNLLFVKNKETYTKLVISKKVNPRLLKDFINVKELVIKYNKTAENLNKYPIINQIESIVFESVEVLDTKTGFLNAPNLKCVEISPNIYKIYYSYFGNCINLKKIIFNVRNNKRFIETIYFPETIKQIIIKYNNKEYLIEPEYRIQSIEELSEKSNNIKVKYRDSRYITNINIDTKEEKIVKQTIVVNYASINNHILYIPDFVTSIGSFAKVTNDDLDFFELSLNLNLINNIEETTQILYRSDLEKLKTITLRSSNNMMLLPNKTVNLEEYGKIENLYFENKKLYVIFTNTLLTINEEGKVETKSRNVIETAGTIELKDLNESELDQYLSFKKLLLLSQDGEFKNAMEIVEDRLVKKLTKNIKG